MSHTCPIESSLEDRIQSQLNDVATRIPLRVLAEYLENLQLERRELLERIFQVQSAIQENPKPSADSDDNGFAMQFEALRKELREQQVHIKRVQKAIEARQKKFLFQEPEWFRVSGSSNSAQNSTSVRREKTRNPIAMIRGEYKGMKLADIAAKVLSAESTPLTTTQITQRIYSPLSDDEFERARNSLSTELRVGAKSSNPRWRKCGRYAYCGLHLHPEAAM